MNQQNQPANDAMNKALANFALAAQKIEELEQALYNFQVHFEDATQLSQNKDCPTYKQVKDRIVEQQFQFSELVVKLKALTCSPENRNMINSGKGFIETELKLRLEEWQFLVQIVGLLKASVPDEHYPTTVKALRVLRSTECPKPADGKFVIPESIR